MSQTKLLHTLFEKSAYKIHQTRLKALFEAVEGVCNHPRLTITHIGRSINNTAKVKHNIKKVDRLCGNSKLHGDIPHLYTVMASYLLNPLPETLPILIDICFLKDHYKLQTIRASLSFKKRSLTLLEESYHGKDAKKAHKKFLNDLKKILPANRQVIIVLDAGFRASWCKFLNDYQWDFIVRVRQGSGTFCLQDQKWKTISYLFAKAKKKVREFGTAVWGKNIKLPCRLIGYYRPMKGRIKKTMHGTRSQQKDSKKYSRSYREPWILATSVSKEKYTSIEIARLYEKRMHIEAGFRDTKSHQFGLGARYSRTTHFARWNVLLVIGNFALFLLWMMGSYVCAEGLQYSYQSNTRKSRKEFSDIFMGQLFLKALPPRAKIDWMKKAWNFFSWRKAL